MIEDWELQIIHIPSQEHQFQKLFSLLSSDEKEQFQSFIFNDHARKYTIVRGQLRTSLGNILNTPPENVAISYNLYGKPFIQNPPFPFFFNLSHSGEYAVFAYSKSSEIGVDIEKINPEILQDKLELLALSENEQKRFNSLSIEEKVKAFYLAWTQKEAILKALGKGLLEDLKEVETSLVLKPGKHKLVFKDVTYLIESMLIADDYLLSIAKIV